MRTKKQMTACLLSFALLLGMIPASEVSAAKKVSLSTKKLTVTKGKSKTLKVKNTKKKVKWKILSGKKYISLKKKGKVAVSVKGKKKGTAKVQAKVGKKKLTCKVTVKNVKTYKTTPTPTVTTTPSGTSAPVPTNPTAPSGTSTPMPTNPTTPLETYTPLPANPTNAPEGANEDDVKALAELIRIHRERGSDVSEDMSNSDEYTWKNGKLTEIKWRAKDLSGTLDVSKFTALTKLYCDTFGDDGTADGENQLSGLILNESIEELYCADNRIETLNTSNALELRILDCSSNGEHKKPILDPEYQIIPGRPYPITAIIGYEVIPFLDLSNNTKLEELICSDNNLETLDLSHNIALTNLKCHYNKLTTLELNNHPSLKTLLCHWNESLASLNLSGATALEYLACDGNKLTDLDLHNNSKLQYISCTNNMLSKLDVTNNIALTYLDCSKNQLTSLDVTRNSNLDLEHIYCDSNVSIIQNSQ